MTKDNPLDFNNDRLAYPHLTPWASHLLAQALCEDLKTRPRAIAALSAARRLVLDEAQSGLPESTCDALAALATELERIEYAFRDLEDGVRPEGITAGRVGSGRRPESNAVLAFEARAVAAVKWLQILNGDRLYKDDAIALVATAIPAALIKHHPKVGDSQKFGCLSAAEQLRAWLDAFREGSRRDGVFQELWVGLQTKWANMAYRKMIGTKTDSTPSPGLPPNFIPKIEAPREVPLYGGWEGPQSMEDATPQQIMDWLREGLPTT